MNNYYVYVYWRLDTNEPFYIGKGKSDRWKKLSGRNKHFENIVNKYPIAVEIIKDNLTEQEAFYWEEKIIEILVFEYGYSIDIPNNRSKEKCMHLVNKTWGGEGTSGRNPFENKTEEEIEEIFKVFKENFKGEGNPFYGKKHSEETRIKMRKNHVHYEKGKHPLCGRKFSQEHRNNLSKAKKGKLKGKDNKRAKSVICLNTMKTFFTVGEATRYYNIKSTSDIPACCKGRQKSAGKLSDGTPLKWMYLSEFLEKCEYISL